MTDGGPAPKREWYTPEQRRAGRSSFDSAADQYGAVRPEYPDEIYDALIALTGIDQHSRLLEMGCGPGIATRALAARGFRITALDLGEDMVTVARRNLSTYSRVEVCLGDFETWDAGARAPFDLIYASTAWHWVDPSVRYPRAAQLLRRGGHLAFWAAEHLCPYDGDQFWFEIQDAYAAIGDALPEGYEWPQPGAMPDNWSAEIEASGLFDDLQIRQFSWNVDYDVEAYIALMETFSSNLLRPPADKEYLYGEFRRRVAARDDPILHRTWGSALYVARLK